MLSYELQVATSIILNERKRFPGTDEEWLNIMRQNRIEQLSTAKMHVSVEISIQKDLEADSNEEENNSEHNTGRSDSVNVESSKSVPEETLLGKDSEPEL